MIPSPRPLRSAAFVLLALTPIACGPGDAPPGDEVPTEPVETRFVELDPEMMAKARLAIATAGPGELRREIQSFGETVVDPSSVAPILSRIRGVVTKVDKHLGDFVEKGELVAELESEALATAIIEYLNREQDLDFARDELERERQLFEQKLSAAETFLAKEQALEKAKIAHAAALQPLLLLHFSEEDLHSFAEAPEASNLTVLEIRSPITGAITGAEIHQGESVEADTEIMRITDLSQVWVEFRVPLDVSFRLKIDEPVMVRNSATAAEARAMVRYVSPIADQASRTVVVRGTLDNREGGWRPGTPVTVDVVVDTQPVDVAVPAAAVVDHGGGQLVFVQAGEGRFEARTISIGGRDDERFEVLNGLEVGEAVVTTNSYLVKAEWLIQAE